MQPEWARKAGFVLMWRCPQCGAGPFCGQALEHAIACYGLDADDAYRRIVWQGEPLELFLRELGWRAVHVPRVDGDTAGPRRGGGFDAWMAGVHPLDAWPDERARCDALLDDLEAGRAFSWEELGLGGQATAPAAASSGAQLASTAAERLPLRVEATEAAPTMATAVSLS